MLICIKTTGVKYISNCPERHVIRQGDIISDSDYHESCDPGTAELSWTIWRKGNFPLYGSVYPHWCFMKLSDWRTLKIDQILC